MATSTSTPSFPFLLPVDFSRTVTEWLKEDCPSFDYAGAVVGESMAEARLFGKSEGVLAGKPFFDQVFRQLSCNVEWYYDEGHTIPPAVKLHLATVRGPVRKILLGERVALNTIARCSGVATKAASVLNIVRRAGYRNILSGTRKTTPGFRLVEKYGMLVGGCDTHRMDLSSMIMLKDNHIAAAGSIRTAVATAKAVGGFSVKVEVECQNEAEADEAIEAGADIIMLDNFSGQGVGSVAPRLKQRWTNKSFLLEVSGGLTAENVDAFVCNDVDIISTSSIHQGVKHLDFSLKIIN